jgi:magnesium chelatase family protein
MSLALVYSRAALGIEAPLVTVEVHISAGLPSLSIVGLPETAVKESKDRVRGAIINSGFEFPTRRITINLAPADLPKDGGRFDLAIALGILAATGQIPAEQLKAYEIAGELALSGELRAIRGALPLALATRQTDRALILPTDNAHEAALAHAQRLHPAKHLLEVCAHLRGKETLSHNLNGVVPPAAIFPHMDLAHVRGQHQAKRALEIAAAGGHNLLMVGPPGTGKSMLASCLPGILPPLDEQQAMEAATIASISEQGFDHRQWGQRAYRAPHHTASAAAIVGGGAQAKPGEISLAHHGVLFLDELPEFDRRVLEVLREPLETGHIAIARAQRRAQYPARFQLIAAMNPSPAGTGDSVTELDWNSPEAKRYRGRISRPLLDRIDLQIEVPRLPQNSLRPGQQINAESSQDVKQRVVAARERQMDRQRCANAHMTHADIDRHCRLDDTTHQLLETAVSKLNLSARGYHRILKVARTIADLQGALHIGTSHVTEAIGYRRLEAHF